MHRALKSQIGNRKSQINQRGYTITEILVVIVLIILLIAMAVPAFNVITGSRSVEGAEKMPASLILQELPGVQDQILDAPPIPNQGRPQKDEDAGGKVGLAK